MAAPTGSPPPPPPPGKLTSVAWEARLPPAGPPCRLDEALQLLQPDRYPSITSAKRAVRRRELRVDGVQSTAPSIMLQGGELLQCMQRQGAAALQQCPQPAAGAAEAWMPSGAAAAGRYRLGVAYEDSHLACVVKPPGIPTDTPPHRGAARGANNATGSAATGASQPGAGAASGASSSSAAAQAVPSVYELLAAQLQPTGELGALRRPRHVHRLDEPTGGLVVVAKTRLAQTQLSAAFMQRRVTKRYRALVWGRLEGRGLVRYCLDGKRCETEYAAAQHTRVDLAALGLRPAAPLAAPQPAIWVTTVDLWPHTGRKHQLRRHMALLGHPLLGETRYSFGYATQRLGSGQAMPPEDHAWLPADAATGGGGGCAAAPPATAAAQEHAVLCQPGGALPAAAADVTRRLALPLCLWAVELQLEAHPATGQPLHCCIPEPPSYGAIRAAVAASSCEPQQSVTELAVVEGDGDGSRTEELPPS